MASKDNPLWIRSITSRVLGWPLPLLAGAYILNSEQIRSVCLPMRVLNQIFHHYGSLYCTSRSSSDITCGAFLKKKRALLRPPNRQGRQQKHPSTGLQGCGVISGQDVSRHQPKINSSSESDPSYFSIVEINQSVHFQVLTGKEVELATELDKFHVDYVG